MDVKSNLSCINSIFPTAHDALHQKVLLAPRVKHNESTWLSDPLWLMLVCWKVDRLLFGFRIWFLVNIFLLKSNVCRSYNGFLKMMVLIAITSRSPLMGYCFPNFCVHHIWRKENICIFCLEYITNIILIFSVLLKKKNLKF